ncbi:hypothetical protein OIE52_03005 [Streptomyces canus]
MSEDHYGVRDVAADASEPRVVRQQVGERGGRGDVVDRDHVRVLDACLGAVEGRSQASGADAAGRR